MTTQQQSVIPYCDATACVAAGCNPIVCTGAGTPSNKEVFERSTRVIPGGVNSSIRAFKAVGGSPYVVARGAGAHVYDVEGKQYVDLVQSYGAVILGHAHPAITSALHDAAPDGTSFGAPTPREMKLAEAISERVPSCERVRFMNSGTEATSTVVRLARGLTGRSKVIIFDGNFHGATDALLAAGGSGVATLGLPGTAGVPPEAVANTIVAPYNVVPEIDETVACVIVEAVAANMGVVAPTPGFLEGLRAACDRVGALLVCGGLPIGAVGGRRDVMENLTPLGKVFHAGTLAGNPMATAAGLAALSELTPDVYTELESRATRLAGLIADATSAAGLPVTTSRVGTLVGIYLGNALGGSRLPINFDEAKKTDEALYARLFHSLLNEGVAMAPGAYEAIFVGLGHTEAVMNDLAERFHRAARAVTA